MKTFILAVHLLFISILCLNAQITLTSNHVVDIGDTIKTATDHAQYTPGSAGANVSWDFSTLQNVTTQMILLLDPATTPEGGDFPNSNLAATNAPGDYIYLNKSDTATVMLGFAGDCDGVPCSFQIEQPEPLLKFPFTFNDSYDFHHVMLMFEDTSNFPGTDSIKIFREVQKQVLADAYGEVITPLGTFQALRMKETSVEIDSAIALLSGVWVNISVDHDTIINYTWWAGLGHAGWALIELSIQDFDNHTGPIYWLTDFTSDPTSTNELELLKHISVYPNPAINKLFVNLDKSYNLDNNLSLVLYDLSGKKVLSQNFTNETIEMDISQLSKGIYLINFDNFSKAGQGRFIIIQ